MPPSELPTQITNTLQWIYRLQLTSASGGNISIKDEEGDIWITPSGCDKGYLQPEDIVCIKKDGSIVGQQRPSSELLFHQAIYLARPDIKAILHAHPDPLVAFSSVGQLPDSNLIAGAETHCGSVGLVGYALPGSFELGELIADGFSKGHDSVILQNHGVVCAAVDLTTALGHFEALVNLARIQINARLLGSPLYPTNEPEAISLPIDCDKTSAPSAEIDQYTQRAYQQGLFTSTIGQIRSTSNGYRIFAQPPYISAFAVTEQFFESRIIPEAYIFLHDVMTVEANQISQIQELLTPDSPVVIVKNTGIFVWGDSLFAAYDRLELIEFTAKALISAYQLGEVQVMNEQAIEDIDQVWKQ